VDGIVNVNKACGVSSHRVVQEVRRFFSQIKAGHSGTLDPMATGVLPVCLGRGTRVVEYMIELPKIYHASVVLGKTTDTEDATGTIIETKSVPMLDRGQVEKFLSSFIGKIEQLPPLYSAVKYKGKPLYKWTRLGEEVPRKVRTAHIYNIQVSELDLSREPHLVFDVECSRGTYIRTLAADLGKKIGCGAHLSGLRRLAVGPYTLENAYTIEELTDLANAGCIETAIQPIDSALIQLPQLALNSNQVEALKQGKLIEVNSCEDPEQIKADIPIRIYDQHGVFKAIGCIINKNNIRVLKTVKYLSA
jgi:tRNA pseudouridine55 synthase